MRVWIGFLTKCNFKNFFDLRFLIVSRRYFVIHLKIDNSYFVNAWGIWQINAIGLPIAHYLEMQSLHPILYSEL